MLTRRSFLQGTTAAAVAFSSGLTFAAQPPAGAINLPEEGRLRPLPSKAISASPLSVGFETLDRRQFDPTRTYEPLGKLGVKWARAQTGWCRCETTKGKYDFTWLDEIVNSLGNQGIETWFNLGYGNRLYTPEAPDVSAVGFAPIFTEEARAGWSAFVDALASHFADRVKCWEIWNEPNWHQFWRPKKPDAAAYVELVKFTAPRIRRRIPGAKIIGMAMALCDLKYLGACLEAGVAEQVDRLSFHPYSPMPESFEPSVAQMRNMLGDRREKLLLWQGECGCPSNPATASGTDKKGRKWDELGQSKWLTRRILADLREEIELTSYFTTVDLLNYNSGNGRSKNNQSYGVLRGTDYSPKPSYYAFQSLCSLLDAQSKRDRRLDATPEGAPDKRFRAAGFVRRGRALCAYWLASDLLDEFTPQSVSLRLPAPADATLEHPVLIDPLSQRVYCLPAAKAQSGVLTIQVPLHDYPLVIADRSVVPMENT